MKFLTAFRKSVSSRFGNADESSARPASLQVEGLEDRCMLSAAGIFYNAEIGQVVVRGGAGNDVGSFDFIDDGTVRASLSGVESQDFALESVTQLVFVGRDGDDTFENNTFYESYQIGGNGNDELTGGSGEDRLSGGNGNDLLDGDFGDDVLLGLGGSDEMYGGEGDDELYGGSGLNFLYGEEGDDTINGGSSVDEIFGGDGADYISGFGGNDIIDTGDGGTADEVDFARGQNGEDTFIGGAGVNLFLGGNGNDYMVGGNGVGTENRMYGQNGDDEMIGGDSVDIMFGQRGNDTLLGMGGPDILKGGYGDDTIDGGTDEDIIAYGDLIANYEIDADGSDLTVTHLDPIDGIDNVSNGETIQFLDEDYEVEVIEIVEIVTVQPIIVSNDDGSNTAGYFGTSEESQIIMDRIDEIYLVAGVDVVWLEPNTWNDTFANVGDADPRPGSDLSAILSAGEESEVANSDPLVLNMYFVEVSAFFPPTSNFTANGYARVDGNGSTVHIGDSLTTFASGRDVAARVTAHELAHNLGLVHVTETENLMANGSELNASQIATILDSEYTVPIIDVL